MFAAGKSASAGKLITQTFTSDTTWVAPTITNNLISAVGQGAAGTAGYWSTLNSIGAYVYPFTTCEAVPVYGPSLDYSVPYGQAQGIQTYASGWTTSSTGQFVSFIRTYIYYWCGTASEWRLQSITFSGTVRRIGTVNLVGFPGYSIMPSSGSAPTPPSTPQAAFCTNLEYYTAPGTGASTTAFGYTFPGGTGGPASPTTYNNIPVTPGASYPIVVPSGGSLTITYIG